jgi:hypothetical protein
MTDTSRAHSHTGEKTRSTCVPVIGLRSSFSRSVTANAAAVAPSRTRTIRSWGHRAKAQQATGSDGPQTQRPQSGRLQRRTGSV